MHKNAFFIEKSQKSPRAVGFAPRSPCVQTRLGALLSASGG